MNTVARYHYTECGLPNVWIEGLCAEDDAGEDIIRIPNVKSLHRLIAKSIVTSKSALTGGELRYLRTEMGLTQTELGKLIHRDRQTVARWEKGKAIDGATEAYIRILAAHKLDLDELDPEEVSGWCTLRLDRKEPVRIRANAGDYRLAA